MGRIGFTPTQPLCGAVFVDKYAGHRRAGLLNTGDDPNPDPGIGGGAETVGDVAGPAGWATGIGFGAGADSGEAIPATGRDRFGNVTVPIGWNVASAAGKPTVPTFGTVSKATFGFVPFGSVGVVSGCGSVVIGNAGEAGLIGANGSVPGADSAGIALAG